MSGAGPMPGKMPSRVTVRVEYHDGAAWELVDETPGTDVGVEIADPVWVWADPRSLQQQQRPEVRLSWKPAGGYTLTRTEAQP